MKNNNSMKNNIISILDVRKISQREVSNLHNVAHLEIDNYQNKIGASKNSQWIKVPASKPGDQMGIHMVDWENWFPQVILWLAFKHHSMDTLSPKSYK